MNKEVLYVIDKMKEYTTIPSLSFQEEKFMEYLMNDIPRTHYMPFYDKKLGCVLYAHTPRLSPFLITVHVDRIPVEPYQWSRRMNKGLILKGQTDNVVSVAIARLLIEKNTPVDILFTTKEEHLRSANQIVAAHKSVQTPNYCYSILDMDIDVAQSMQEIECGAISLRDRDNLVPYNSDLVKEMRDICLDNGVDFITKDGHWLLCQIGTAIEADPTVRGMYFGLPIFNYHSNHELINTHCIENAIKFFDCIKGEYDGKSGQGVSTEQAVGRSG